MPKSRLAKIIITHVVHTALKLFIHKILVRHIVYTTLCTMRPFKD